MAKKLLGLDKTNLNEKKFEITKVSRDSIAIIGINANFATGDLQDFWEDICQGRDFVGKIPETRRIDTERYLHFIENVLDEDEVSYKESSYLRDIDKFDYRFFGLSPKEASLMDPQQRIFLETVWGAVEDAGYGGKKLKGTNTGVYLGFTNFPGSQYFQAIAMIDPLSLAVSLPDNLPSIIASRISYLLDLKGTSLVVDTACSSSLMAVHLACQGIRSGDCEQAIAGSVKINLWPLNNGVKLGIESSTERTMTFDEDSDGTSVGEGSIAILLKPLHKALADHDHVYAVIRGSATNQDGSSAGITAPNVLAQRDVIIAAWKAAGIEPETVSYIEAHGTATKLGDPVEIDGLTQAFQKYTDRKQFCAIGSVKSNLGHLDNAAGLAGLVKAVLALKHGLLPPTIHFNSPNRHINFVESPVYVNKKLRKWKTDGCIKRCGVSSFGMSGTNCHVVLEEAPPPVCQDQTGFPYQILVISAKTVGAFDELLQRYKAFLEKGNNPLDLEAICYTASTGREHYQYRLALILTEGDNLREKLLEFENLRAIGNLDSNLPDAGIYYHSGKFQPEEVLNINDHEGQDLVLQVIQAIQASQGSDRGLFGQLCELYLQGVPIDWELLYQNRNCRKISLPTYPFEKDRCWLKLPEEETAPQLFEELYYQMSWTTKERKPGRNAEKGTVLILGNPSEKSKFLTGYFQGNGYSVIQAQLGVEFFKENEGQFFINGSITDYQKLLAEIKEQQLVRIFHLYTLDNQIPAELPEVEANLERGVYNLFHLIKAVYHNLNQNIKYEIVLVAENVAAITGDEVELQPENAALFGFGKVVNLENSQIRCRCIDIERQTSWEQVIAEAEAESPEYHIAFRNGKRYVSQFQRKIMAATKETAIRDQGVYIITGGTGGMGLTFAKYLASKGKVNLALINRSQFVAKDEWEAIIQNEQETRLKEKVLTLLEIEKMGAQVDCFSADITNEADLSKILEELRTKFGRINGIIHSAGIAGNGFIFNKEEEDFRNVLAPKVKGTWLLDWLTASDEMDFFILCSSITSVFGVPGQSDYTAANAYLDFFASRGRRAVSTINWPAWKEVGMAVDFGVNVDGFFKGMTNSQALLAFETIVNNLPPRVLVGEINYAQIPADFTAEFPFDFSGEILAELQKKNLSLNGPGQLFNRRNERMDFNKERAKNVALTGKEIDNYSEFEKIIAQVWCEVLGFEILDVNDNFFELGGNSVLLIRAESLLLQQFPGQITITDLFTYPTISKLAGFLNHLYNEDPQQEQAKMVDQDIDNLLNELTAGKISIDDVLSNF